MIGNSVVYFAGGEEIDFTVIGQGQIGGPQTNFGFPVVNNQQWQYDLTPNHYRPGYARYALTWTVVGPANNQSWMRTLQFTDGNGNLIAATNFWTSARMQVGSGSFNSSGLTANFLRFIDSSGNQRLRVRSVLSGVFPSNIVIETVNNSGIATTLATSSSVFGSLNPNTPDKIDIYINYGNTATSTFNVYCNNSLVVSYIGNLLTNGSTTNLSFVDFGMVQTAVNSPTLNNSWSEIIVASNDTRNASLVTQSPMILGNTDTWSNSSIDSTTFTTNTSNTSVSGSQAIGTIGFFRILTLPIQTSATVGFDKLPYSGNIISITGPVITNAPIGFAQMAIYSDTGLNGQGTITSLPNVLLGTSSNIANISPSTSTTFTFTPPITVETGQTYWIAFKNTAAYNFSYTNLSTNSQYNYASQSGQSTFPATASSAGQVSITPLSASETIVAPAVGFTPLDQINIDASNATGQTQLYQVGPSALLSNLSVISVIQHFQATKGSSGPGNVNAVIRTGSTNYDSNVTITPTSAWASYSTHWDVNPSSNAAWSINDLGQANTNFNIGLKSIT